MDCVSDVFHDGLASFGSPSLCLRTQILHFRLGRDRSLFSSAHFV